jgi:hypothetical protein
MNFESSLVDSKISLLDIQKKHQILSFLDSKIKSSEEDPDRRWITTWNHYLNHLKYFFRWLYNTHQNNNNDKTNYQYVGIDNNVITTYPMTYEDWKTPSFIQIKKKKTKRTSPYLETELWEREELLSILKYEPSKRNKSALALFWDLNARNHEVTLLKIKHIRLKERYGEG